MEETIYFRHRVGDGVHYINDNFRTFPDGTFQPGDTSDGCILLNLQTILFRNHISASVEEVWNHVYPNDPMSLDDVAYIITTAIAFTEPFDPTSPDNISDAIEDLRKMGCPELADTVRSIFLEKGVPV